jgi:hypothetical protein
MTKKIADEATVFAAADALQAQGEEPTYERVVEFLGGGSNSTIKPYLINWKQMAGISSRPTPDVVLTRAKALAEALWGMALNQAQSEIDRAKLATDDEIERSRRALLKSVELSGQFEAERNKLAIELKSAESDILEARLELRKVDALKLELAQAREVAEECRRQCELMAREIATLKGENNALRDQGQLLLARVTSVTPRSRAASGRGRSGKSTS